MINSRKDASSWTLVVCGLLAQLALAKAGNVVPVMLWYGESSSGLVNPLHKTSRPEFETILSERVGKGQPSFIVFVKDNFCVEDITHHKESLQQLSSAGSLTYLTSVESPLSVFENLSSYNVTKEDDLVSLTDNPFALVQVSDLNAVPEIYNMVRESSPNLVVALTGKSCHYTSLERAKRETPNAPTDSKLIIKDEHILLYADKYPLIKINNSEYSSITKLTGAKINSNNKSYNLTMSYSFQGGANSPAKIVLTAYFKIKRQYFILDSLTYIPDGDVKQLLVLKSKDEISFPFNFSYNCNHDRIFRSRSNAQTQVSIKFPNIQMQMDAKVFSDNVYDCVGFMSIPIWTGIFVTAILALIMIWGLTMIMDIRTMDRFDDPKGKTITISAQE